MINTGTFYGQGLVSGTGSVGAFGSATGGRVVSSANINTMSRNTAAGYEQQMQIIEKYLKNGEVDKAIKKYESLLDDAQESNSYSNYTINESQAASILNKAYAQATGSSFMDDLDKKTASPVLSGLAQGIPVVGLLFANDTTKAEAFAKLDGDKVSFKDKAKEYLGAATSGAAAGAAIGTATGAWTLGAATVVGAGIGAIVGVGQAILKDLF